VIDVRLTLRNSVLTEEFDYNFIKHALCEYKNPRVKINDLLKKNEIIRVKKGLYVFGPELAREPYSKETLANLIYGPSYISLEYALYFYDLIPERVETVTSVTNKRKKLFNTPIGIFSYRYIKPSIYAHGITLFEMDKHHSILIATKEKALSDMLYFTEKMTNDAQLKKHLFENLRLDREAIMGLNLREVKKLAGLYGNNVRLFHNLLENVK
jgi:predicted transcriptional regulator of viral defense system